jgi:glucoamylase
VWYTTAGGVITEVYYPDVDTPQIRDLQFLVTDGSTFFHDGSRDFDSTCTPIDPDALGLRLTNVAIDKKQPYTLVLDVIAEPGSPCLLVRTRIQCAPDLLSKLRIYVLIAPHVNGFGAGNSAYIARTINGDRLLAHRGNTWMAAGADRAFKMMSCGYVGVNDGWQDIVGSRRLPIWNFTSAENGNVALTGEIDLAGRSEFVLAVAFGQGDAQTPNSALVAMQEALSYPFVAPAPQYSHLQEFIGQWKKATAGKFVPAANATFDQGHLFMHSWMVLLTHEDKSFDGAIVASLGIPWGQDAGDSDGGYHLVWPRDMSQSATALMAAGETDVPLRALVFLATSQLPDGRFHQKFYVNGQPLDFDAQQLDEYSFPVILAYRLKKAGALQFFQPRAMALAAAGALIADGPMTQQERWEENEGYSPSTLAANIAALVCAANFADERPDGKATAQFLLEYADFLESHVEAWCVTTRGSLLSGVSRYYIRMLPTSVKGGARNPQLPEDPNTAIIYIHNRDDQQRLAKDVVDGGFLELVRYGIRAPGDPLIEDSLKVIDAKLRDTLPGGPCWRRYNDDGYGQRDDGSSFNNTGVGRPWPLLTGERAHYELAAGRDVSSYVKAMEEFSGQRKLLAEQLWNAPDLPGASPPLIFGKPSGSAMPLAWAHAEYIRLVRSISDGKVFDLVDIVADRYLKPHAPSPLEIWNFDRQIPAMPRGKRLRITLKTRFRLRWSTDDWATFDDQEAALTGVGIYYQDIPTDTAKAAVVIFTFYWPDQQHWEGVNYSVRLT